MLFHKSRLFVVLGKIFISIIVVVLVARISFQSRKNTHPDEYVHVDAFHYFMSHWWPPDYGSDQVVYSEYGWSRVYNGEFVYILYGKIGRVITLVLGQPIDSYILYRMINVCLLCLTLLILFTARSRYMHPGIIGITFLCIPQALYIYAYANSDAWGISLSIFLFVLTLKIISNPLVYSLSWKYLFFFGTLVGLIILAKVAYILALIIPFLLMVIRIAKDFKSGDIKKPAWLIKRLLIITILAFIISAPLRIIYPLTQVRAGNTTEIMREAKANDGYRPSNPTRQTYHMAAKGETYTSMLHKFHWGNLSAISFYGLFGYMNTISPAWIYTLVSINIGILIIVSFIRGLYCWKCFSIWLKCCLIASPIILAINIYASMFNSLHIDFQPQGRYLMASLIPVSFILLGDMHEITTKNTTWWLRAVIFLVMYMLMIYELMIVVMSSSNIV